MGLLEYAIEPTWRMLLKDMGLSASNILKRAELPEELPGTAIDALTIGEQRQSERPKLCLLSHWRALPVREHSACACSSTSARLPT